jgi:uncharacterized membrane protein
MTQPVPFSYWIILAPILLVAALTTLLLALGRKGPRPPEEAWRGVFYSNTGDPALLVPKRYGIGYTLNFGNPWSWVVMLLILAAALAPFILLVTILHRSPTMLRP